MPNMKHTADLEKSFSDRLLECMGNQSRHAWGKSIGLNPGLLDRIFRQKTIPSANNLLKIADALGVSVDWLLRGGHATKISNTLFSAEEINSMELAVQIMRNVTTKNSLLSMLDMLRRIPEEEIILEAKQSPSKKKRTA